MTLTMPFGAFAPAYQMTYTLPVFRLPMMPVYTVVMVEKDNEIKEKASEDIDPEA